MNNLLFVDASPHGSHSLGARIAHEAIAQWRAARPNARVVSRSLGQPGLPSLSADYARAVVARQPDSDPALAYSEQLIAEVEHSDGILISTPMHNFTVPAALKLWIDFVLRIGRTFTPRRKASSACSPIAPCSCWYARAASAPAQRRGSPIS